MTTLFVTSSGTDVGKTFVMTMLLRELRAAGHATRALKPVATGLGGVPLPETDSGRLLLAQEIPATPENVTAITPWRFDPPLSPDMAAARERRAIPVAELIAFCRAQTESRVTLIEGIGGVMVPLDDSHTVRDWIAALGVPALLVVGSYLGSLSHSLTAATALRERGVPLAAVIVSESVEQPVALDETVTTLARFLRPTPVRGLPRMTGSQPSPQLLPLLLPYIRAADSGHPSTHP
jgi:dethiobiotin synthetase